MIARLDQVMRQTKQGLFGGDTQAPEKLVSLFERSTEIIPKGKAAKPTECGKLVKIQEAANQIIIDYQVDDQRPHDADLLLPPIEVHQQRLGRLPRLVAAGAGFYSPAKETPAQQRVVKRVAIPHRSSRSPARRRHQKKRWFRQGQKWRTGSEGGISLLQRRHGLHRCRYRGQGPGSLPAACGLTRRLRSGLCSVLCSVMTLLAGQLFCQDQVGLDGRAVGVVAHTAILKNVHRVGMNLREIFFLVTVETAAFETETTAAADAVTVRALDARRWRVLGEGLVLRRRVLADKEIHFLAAPLPNQRQGMLARVSLRRSMKNVGEGFFRNHWHAVELELPRRRGGHDVNFAGSEGGAIGGAHDFARIFLAGDDRSDAQQYYGNSRTDRPPTHQT